MSTIYTVGGNTSGGSTLVANGGGVAKKSYASTYPRIAKVWRPKYKSGEAEKVAKEALKYVGYLEKKTNAHLEDFTANAGYNNYNMFSPHAKKETGSGIYVNGVAWCDIFVDDVVIRALGVTRAKSVLGGWSAYTPTSSAMLDNAGATQIKDLSKTKYGDIIFFKDSSGKICHTEIVVTGYGKEVAPVSTKYTQKDFLNDVYKILGVKTPKEALEKTITLSTKEHTKHALVLPLQKYLKALGYYKGVCDKEYGILNKNAVIEYQEKVLKYSKGDGVVTAKNKTWKSLLGA